MMSNSAELGVVEPENRPTKRKNNRLRCSFRAKLHLKDTFVCDAVIKDISQSGMLLYVPSSSWIPSVFQVHCKQYEGGVSVRRVWYSNNHLGVKFTHGKPKGAETN